MVTVFAKVVGVVCSYRELAASVHRKPPFASACALDRVRQSPRYDPAGEQDGRMCHILHRFYPRVLLVDNWTND